MKRSPRVIKVGILGCGAIGSGIAKSTRKELKSFCRLTGLYDRDEQKALDLAKTLSQRQLKRDSFPALLRNCDLVVEAINTPNARYFIRQALLAKKNVLAMSVGQMLSGQSLFALARRHNRSVLIPSGAVAGIDAVKAASLAGIERITLTTRKPLAGLSGVPYLTQKGIDVAQITEETVLFEGDVDSAVKFFPKNINVAATLALASQAKTRVTVRIVTSPHFTSNSHEIDVRGRFGRMVSRTENVVSPDNPKTSYLAVLSGIQTLKDFCSGSRIGT